MILRDPVHGLVSFESDEEQIVPSLLETAEVQRLRRIRQLGLTSLSYPGADHTRFSHALGSAHVMASFLARLRSIDEALPFWQRVSTDRAREALAAALLHDLGHGPLSHLFEDSLPEIPRHELWTQRMILDPTTEVHQVLCRYDATLPDRVADLVVGKHEIRFLARTVSGTFDVDRCDYLLRDAHFTGVSYGRFDLPWLLRSLRFGTSPGPDGTAPALAIDGPRGLPAIESFILARLFMFQQVYFHKASRASEWMLARILERVKALVQDGTRLNAMPRALGALIRDGDVALGEYLALDDGVLWVAIEAWRRERDAVLSDLASRLYARRLFKTYELYGEQASPAAREALLRGAREIARQRGFDPEIYVGLDAASDVPFDDTNEPLMVVFPSGVERRPADVSFLLSRLRGQVMERVRLILAPELRSEVVEAIETGSLS
jgi:hypothetical protein